jgi:hypothetical protein
MEQKINCKGSPRYIGKKIQNFFNSAFGQFRALLRFRTKQAFGFELVLFFISLGGKST